MIGGPHGGRAFRALAGFCLAAALLAVPASSARAAASVCEPDGVQADGAIYRVCMPGAMAWNGDLVIWAHGYVDATQPVAIPEDQLCLGGGGFCIPTIVNSLGFGFITTSYRMNGLVTTGVDDVLDLVGLFVADHGAPHRIYLVGASEGGLVTTLAVEQHPEVFDGGLAACGPIGDFERQVSYFGDFRVLFDYFFPGLLDGSPRGVPQADLDNWDALWTGTLEPVIFDPAHADALQQLLRTARAPYLPSDPSTMVTTVHDALWYNVFATNDLLDKLGGSPYDNLNTVYRGSSDDAALNAAVARYAADPGARAAIEAGFQTTGMLDVPLVNLHTILDQQVPFVHEFLYGAKVRAAGATDERVLVPSLRYGHCQFKPWEALLSFAILVSKVAGQAPDGAAAVLSDPADRDAYARAAAAAGLAPAARPFAPRDPLP